MAYDGGCDTDGVWIHFPKAHFSWSLTEALLKGVSVLILAAYMRISALRARRRPDGQKRLVFAIYRRIIYATMVIDLATSVLLGCLGSSMPLAVLALSWASSRFITEGLTFFLLQSGVGMATISKTLCFASAWAVCAYGAYFVIHGLRGHLTLTRWLALAYFSVPLLAYVLLLFAPVSLVPRRPAVRPVAIMMVLIWGTLFVREALRLAHLFVPTGLCWWWSLWAALVFVAFPWVIYRALVMDSLWWQGLYSNPRVGNLNAPLLGMWDVLPPNPAMTLATLISDMEESSLPVIPFGQLRLLTQHKYASGSNSRVYRGEYRGEVVAVKMLFSMELDAEAIRDFCLEARRLHSLAHPNILSCRGVCIMPPAICLITEWCEHGSLYAYLKQQAREAPVGLGMCWAERVRLMRDCAAGVAHMHSRGIVHTDIKSLNFLVTSDPLVVKLGDVGEAREIGERPADNGPVRPRTAFWSAPEVLALHAREYTTAMDVYSLALVMNEVATLEVPFGSEPFASLRFPEFAGLVWAGSRPPVAHDMPVRLKDLVQRSWRREVAERPTAEDVFMELLAIGTELDVGLSSSIECETKKA